MGVFSRQIAQAKRQIAAKGETCTWNVTAAPVVADQTKPWIDTPGAATTFSVAIVFLKDITALKGGDVSGNTKKAIMASVPFVPKLSDTITRSDGTLLQITSIEPLSPNGQVIMYTLKVSA